MRYNEQKMIGVLFMKEITACFTGHRSLPDDKLNQLSETLKATICEAYDKGYRCFCSGGAVGFDLLAAEAVLSLKGKYNDMKLILIIPCPEQTKYWPDKEIKRYEKIMSRADKTVCVSEHYFKGCMQKRNRFLVDNSSLCIYWLTKESGGTKYTVDYTRNKGVKLINIADYFI